MFIKIIQGRAFFKKDFAIESCQMATIDNKKIWLQS
jgi:hypothetical protein